MNEIVRLILSKECTVLTKNICFWLFYIFLKLTNTNYVYVSSFKFYVQKLYFYFILTKIKLVYNKASSVKKNLKIISSVQFFILKEHDLVNYIWAQNPILDQPASPGAAMLHLQCACRCLSLQWFKLPVITARSLTFPIIKTFFSKL